MTILARRRVTLHSLRRFVKSTISDLGHSDYSGWFIGHAGSTYYRKTEKEKLYIFRRIEPCLTYLDYSSLEAEGADIHSRLEDKDKEILELKKKLELYEGRVSHINSSLTVIIRHQEFYLVVHISIA